MINHLANTQDKTLAWGPMIVTSRKIFDCKECMFSVKFNDVPSFLHSLRWRHLTKTSYNRCGQNISHICKTICGMKKKGRILNQFHHIHLLQVIKIQQICLKKSLWMFFEDIWYLWISKICYPLSDIDIFYIRILIFHIKDQLWHISDAYCKVVLLSWC